MTTIEERLARIERTQEMQTERLDRMVELMERTVRLEERHGVYDESIRRIGARVEKLEQRMVRVENESGRSFWLVSRIERLLWLGATALAASSSWWLEHLRL